MNVDPETGGILTEIAVSVSQAGGPAGTSSTPVHPIDVGQAAVWTVRSDRLLYRVDPEDGDVENVVLEGGLSARTTSPWDTTRWISRARGLFEVNPSTIEQEGVFISRRKALSSELMSRSAGRGVAGRERRTAHPHRPGDRAGQDEDGPRRDRCDRVRTWLRVDRGHVRRIRDQVRPDTLDPIDTIEIANGVDAGVRREGRVGSLARSVSSRRST